ncbi:MAG TPA: NrfD/PsrC family molybdoenzyme membrane anchor subunit, partial [Saprospiraceae bacterium]|nr:NrfD/PsrC family molybdoenzyme membrane anchor subunit [Saprospiraceae bacterium]
MRYGFIIDNRKCIGCHACTTACKAEHDVPIGVNRTWVKQVEKGVFPNTRRIFSVLRCNHCTDAPCVEICPVEALYIRNDGIVDFDKRRCIGCKSCMQACPYDALYIDPDTHTAAKCNYCAHRIDIGLEPACVNVCPEHAIISGNMDDPESEIAQLLGREQVTVRKQEKGTVPNLFYINGDEASLAPDLTERSDQYLWSAQTRGVGHYARAAEKIAWSNDDVVQALMAQSNDTVDQPAARPRKSVDVLIHGDVKANRVYDTPDKGILWGWEVPAYVLTKAVATGVFLLFMLAKSLNITNDISGQWSIGVALVFLLLTGGFLVKDLDRPDRFLNVLLRPQWRSWLTRGGYAITVFGGLLTLQFATVFFGWNQFADLIAWINVPVAILVSVYTAFLFAQAKGRDFWQNPLLPMHMLAHSIMAGAAVLIMMRTFGVFEMTFPLMLEKALIYATLANLVIMLAEFAVTHPTVDATKTATMIVRGRYAMLFWGGVVLLGNLLPLVLLSITPIGITHV